MDDYKQNHVASRKHLSYQHYIKTVATSMLWRGSDQTFTTYEMSVNTNQVTHSHSFSFVHIHSHSLTFTHSHSLPPSLPLAQLRQSAVVVTHGHGGHHHDRRGGGAMKPSVSYPDFINIIQLL